MQGKYANKYKASIANMVTVLDVLAVLTTVTLPTIPTMLIVLAVAPGGTYYILSTYQTACT